jgi:hypothetical protein
VIEAKKRVLAGILALLVVWPAVHYGLVAALDLDPWRFCGFAMYATPAAHQWVFMIELRGDKRVHIHHTWLTDEGRKAYRTLRKDRALLGELAPPHALAQAIFDERPEIEALEIVLIRDVISPRTSHTIARPGTAYIYRR